MTIKQHKVVVALPIPLEPDSIYYVRNGGGFDIHVTNNSGVVVGYELNASLDKVDKVVGKQLSDENYTLTEKQKLGGVADEATKNRADSENADKVHAHTVEQVLGLGTAATKNVGELAGDVLPVGVSRLGQNPNPQTEFNLNTDGMQHGLGLYYVGPNVGVIGSSFMSETPAFVGTEYNYDYQKAYIFFGANNLASGSKLVARHELYHTGNTTTDPDGTIKASSPVINLFTDKHDLHNEGQFGATPTVVRKSKGVYEITGTLGLRSEGWYLDTPSDRNGNKYFNIEWTQNITPEAVEGVVDEYRDDIVVTIETFERVWNKDTGLFENGTPIDINDLQDRFVQLRFNEIKVEHEDIVDDLP